MAYSCLPAARPFSARASPPPKPLAPTRQAAMVGALREVLVGGFLRVVDWSKKGRKYALAAPYQTLVDLADLV